MHVSHPLLVQVRHKPSEAPATLMYLVFANPVVRVQVVLNEIDFTNRSPFTGSDFFSKDLISVAREVVSQVRDIDADSASTQVTYDIIIFRIEPLFQLLIK